MLLRSDEDIIKTIQNVQFHAQIRVSRKLIDEFSEKKVGEQQGSILNPLLCLMVPLRFVL